MNLILSFITIVSPALYLVCALFILGYGLSYFVIPPMLRKYGLWLIPWVTIISMILLLTIASCMGFSVLQTSYVVIPVLLLLSVYVVRNYKIIFPITMSQDIFLLCFVALAIITHLSPLIRRERFLTSISLGNNDVIVYASTPDYLKVHSIHESFSTSFGQLKPAENGITNLLHDGYRWGTPIISSFFLVLTGLSGYQMAYLYQVLLFSLLTPLLYLLFQILYKKSWVALVFLSFLSVFNANMAYMLYHNFAGQVIFWGLYVVLTILFVSYFKEERTKDAELTLHEATIGATIAAIYMSYHEGVIFAVAPIILYFLYKLIDFKKVLPLFLSLSRIALVTILLSSINIINGTIFDLIQAGGVDGPIGWQLFRPSVPFANPFEIMGFSSLHTSEPLPIVTALVVSVLVVGIFVIGLKQNSVKILTLAYAFVTALFLYWSLVIHNNFFVYNRVVTYSLPVLITIFTIGFVDVFGKKRFLRIVTMCFLIVIVTYHGLMLTFRFTDNHLSVDRSLVSLQDLERSSVDKTFYLDQVLLSAPSYWRMIWMEYFLYPGKNIISPSNYNLRRPIKDGDLVLAQTSIYGHPPLKIPLLHPIWNNGYYTLAQLCYSSTCIEQENIDLSFVDVGTSDYEDAVLIEGWSTKEGDHRWAMGKKSVARFVIPKGHTASTLIFEASSLAEPQKVTFTLDNEEIGSVSLTKEWKEYNIELPYKITAGKHIVTMRFSHVYTPAEVLGNTDVRELAGNFRYIKLK